MAIVSRTPTDRYPRMHPVKSSLDYLEDLRTFAGFYCSRDFVEQTMIEHHGYAVSENTSQQAELVCEFVRMALQFVDQALADLRSDASFVSCYYAALNLLKACVSLTPRAPDLSRPEHRRHGVARDPLPDPAPPVGFMDDEIRLYPEGALALAYQTLAGTNVSEVLRIPVRTLFAQMAVVSAEVGIAGMDVRIAEVSTPRARMGRSTLKQCYGKTPCPAGYPKWSISRALLPLGPRTSTATNIHR